MIKDYLKYILKWLMVALYIYILCGFVICKPNDERIDGERHTNADARSFVEVQYKASGRGKIGWNTSLYLVSMAARESQRPSY